MALLTFLDSLWPGLSLVGSESLILAIFFYDIGQSKNRECARQCHVPPANSRGGGDNARLPSHRRITRLRSDKHRLTLHSTHAATHLKWPHNSIRYLCSNSKAKRLCMRLKFTSETIDKSTEIVCTAGEHIGTYSFPPIKLTLCMIYIDTVTGATSIGSLNKSSKATIIKHMCLYFTISL